MCRDSQTRCVQEHNRGNPLWSAAGCAQKRLLRPVLAARCSSAPRRRWAGAGGDGQGLRAGPFPAGAVSPAATGGKPRVLPGGRPDQGTEFQNVFVELQGIAQVPRFIPARQCKHLICCEVDGGVSSRRSRGARCTGMKRQVESNAHSSLVASPAPLISWLSNL